MDYAFTLVVLFLTVVCVMAATRPSRRPARSRPAPPHPSPPSDQPGTSGPGESAGGHDPRSGARRRWDRRDLARALAIDLVAPGGDGEPWPTRR